MKRFLSKCFTTYRDLLYLDKNFRGNSYWTQRIRKPEKSKIEIGENKQRE